MKNIHPLLLCLFALLVACTPMKKEHEENIDHIILGINDLDKGIAQFKELTGITPVFGGIHPNSFTHNALVALDGEMYIEIMAPRPDAQQVPDYFLTLENLTPIDWAVRTRDTQQTKEKLNAAGFIISERREGSRAKSDGTLLSWITFGIENQEDFPFFIEWGTGSVHPSASSPAGCSLNSFYINTPEVEAMGKLNTILQLGATVAKRNKKQLRVTLNTPKDVVSF